MNEAEKTPLVLLKEKEAKLAALLCKIQVDPNGDISPGTLWRYMRMQTRERFLMQARYILLEMGEAGMEPADWHRQKAAEAAGIRIES